MSAPIISAGTPTVNYGRSSDLHLHAIPTRREHFVSPRSSGNVETATHYKIKPERDSLAIPSSRIRSRRNTVDASSKPIIVTPTSSYNVVIGEPRSARHSKDDVSDYREDGYIQPASSQHRHRDRGYSGGGYRGSRSQHTIDNADISERHPHDREAASDRLLRVGSARDGQMYPRARPITDDTIKRHPDTVKDDYGDDGYGYTNPRDLVEYDLENTARGSQGPQRSRSRRESWDNSRPGRPVSIGGYGDIQRDSRTERERGPPPSTRGFDRIPSERPNSMYHMTGTMHMPMPHEHIAGSPLAQAPSSAYPSDSLGRRTSTRRPVSVYNDDRDRRDRDRPGRDEYDIVDGRARGVHTFGTTDDVQSRGFGIHPSLLGASNVVTVQPPASVERVDRVEGMERMERTGERLSPRNRDDKRYHDSGERRYHASERDYRRDDRERGDRVVSDERRPDHDDKSDNRNLSTGIAAGSIAAAAMGIGASAVRESRHSDEERERERDREQRRRRRDSDQYYESGRSHRNTAQADEPPIVDLSGRYPIERTSPPQDRNPREPPRDMDREHMGERDRESERRERERDSDNRRDPQREQESRKELPLQSERVDLSDRYPVIERNVAKEDTHYPSDNSRSSPPISRRDRDRERDYESDSRSGSRRDRLYEEAALGRETIASPLAMNEKEARDLRALREDMGLDRAVADDSPPPPRPPKEPLETSPPAVGFSRQSTDKISERPLDPQSRQDTGERSFVPPDMRAQTSTATNSSIPTQSSRDSRPSYRDRGYSSTSTSSSSGSNIGTPREHSRERTRDLTSSTAVQVVSPPRSPSSSQATFPVKGILKPPRVFPELPPEERPGVAPLIDKRTGKNWDGREMADVPPTARWTKISRKLVNPEALEKGKERYEVRDDFVVVLRVLTKDEVQGYAILTQNIRAEREDEERRERRRRGEDTEVDNEGNRRRRRDDDETEEERAERKRKERERDERRKKYEEDETSDEREERKVREREERHRRRREDRYRREAREGETADEAEERRRREKEERHARHERRRREKREQYGDEEYDRDREERRRKRKERDERRRRDRGNDSESDTTEDERDDDRRRRRRDRE